MEIFLTNMTLRRRLARIQLSVDDYDRLSEDENDNDNIRQQRYRLDHPTIYANKGRNYAQRSKTGDSEGSKVFREKELACKKLEVIHIKMRIILRSWLHRSKV